MISFVGAKLYITFVYGLWFLYPIRCKRCQSRNQKSPVFTSESKGKQTETILNLELRNRCSTAELHWHPLSINSHVANILHFGRVKVNGKPIRQASNPRLSQAPPPVGGANELAPHASTRTIYLSETQRIESSEHLCGRVAEWLKAPDSKSGLGAILTWVRIPPLPPSLNCCFSTGWRNQRRQVPVKVPVKSIPGYCSTTAPVKLGNHSRRRDSPPVWCV